MENMENSTVQENISKTQIENNKIEEPISIKIDEPSPIQPDERGAKEENDSSISILKESYTKYSSENSFPPSTVSSGQGIQQSRETKTLCSTSKTRCNNLSNPKGYCVRDTLQTFGNTLADRSRENLRKIIHEENIMQAAKGVHLKKCISTPTPQQRSGRREPANIEHADQRIQKLNVKLKRYAFDRLADKIFAELPHHVLQADITKLSEQSAKTQLMINVIFDSMRSYAAKPLSMYEQELYLHLSVGLAQFIQGVVESVRQRLYSAESITPEEQEQFRRKDSITTALLGDHPEVKFLLDSGFFKPKTSNADDGPIEN